MKLPIELLKEEAKQERKQETTYLLCITLKMTCENRHVVGLIELL
jgi:hypothetical protein